MRQKQIFWFAMLAFLPGCDGCPQEERKAMTERVKCVGKTYHAPQSGSAKSIGINMDGDLAFHTTDVSIAEAFGTIFECEHGSFVTNRKDIWEKTKQNEYYTCSYNEVWEVTEKERKLVKLDLISVDQEK